MKHTKELGTKDLALNIKQAKIHWLKMVHTDVICGSLAQSNGATYVLYVKSGVWKKMKLENRN